MVTGAGEALVVFGVAWFLNAPAMFSVCLGDKSARTI